MIGMVKNKFSPLFFSQVVLIFFLVDFNFDDATKLCLLGDNFLFGFSSPQSFSLAFSRYTSASLLSHPKAFLMLGTLHEFGFGVPKSPLKAFEFYSKVILNCDDRFLDIVAEGYNRLGRIWKDGKGVDVDLKEAEVMFRGAADRKSFDGMTNLGGLLEDRGRNEEAVKWYRCAVEGGCPRAMNALGRCKYRGIGGEKDFGGAVELFRKSVELVSLMRSNFLKVFFYWLENRGM
jgi:TPR repeat protein